MGDFVYYATRRNGMYELRQTRFLGRASEHPHDVCAVARTIPELRDMVEKYLKGPTDWSRVSPSPFVRIGAAS